MMLGVVLLGTIGLYQHTFALAQETGTAQTSSEEAQTDGAGTGNTEGGEQPDSTTPPTETATPTVIPTVLHITNDPTAVLLDPPLAFLAVLMLLILAIFVLSRLFTYLTESREDYYSTVREFAGKGVFFSPVMVQPIADTLRTRALEETETISFEVTGPGALVRGVPGVFMALRNGISASSATWDLRAPNGDAVPTDTAVLEADAGSGNATVTAAKPGALVLVASLPATPETPVLTVRTFINVVEPPVTGNDVPPLPFIGQGFGSIISAIVLIAALVVLASTRAIDADVVGVVLGSLAGYLFGVGIGNKT